MALIIKGVFDITCSIINSVVHVLLRDLTNYYWYIDETEHTQQNSNVFVAEGSCNDGDSSIANLTDEYGTSDDYRTIANETAHLLSDDECEGESIACENFETSLRNSENTPEHLDEINTIEENTNVGLFKTEKTFNDLKSPKKLNCIWTEIENVEQNYESKNINIENLNILGEEESSPLTDEKCNLETSSRVSFEDGEIENANKLLDQREIDQNIAFKCNKQSEVELFAGMLKANSLQDDIPIPELANSFDQNKKLEEMYAVKMKAESNKEQKEVEEESIPHLDEKLHDEASSVVTFSDIIERENNLQNYDWTYENVAFESQIDMPTDVNSHENSECELCIENLKDDNFQEDQEVEENSDFSDKNRKKLSEGNIETENVKLQLEESSCDTDEKLLHKTNAKNTIGDGIQSEHKLKNNNETGEKIAFGDSTHSKILLQNKEVLDENSDCELCIQNLIGNSIQHSTVQGKSDSSIQDGPSKTKLIKSKIARYIGSTIKHPEITENQESNASDKIMNIYSLPNTIMGGLKESETNLTVGNNVEVLPENLSEISELPITDDFNDAGSACSHDSWIDRFLSIISPKSPVKYENYDSVAEATTPEEEEETEEFLCNCTSTNSCLLVIDSDDEFSDELLTSAQLGSVETGSVSDWLYRVYPHNCLLPSRNKIEAIPTEIRKEEEQEQHTDTQDESSDEDLTVKKFFVNQWLDNTEPYYTELSTKFIGSGDSM